MSLELTEQPYPQERDDLDDDPEDEECRCVRIDVDLDDARDCPEHGPNSRMARRQREQEASDEAAYWRGQQQWWDGD